MRPDERITAFLDYVRMNNVAHVSERALIDAVQSAVRTILVRGDRSEGEKLQARLYGSLIREGVRELRNDPSRTLSLNCYWAGFDLGIILRPDRSPEEIERIRAKARSLMASALGKRSAEVRSEKIGPGRNMQRSWRSRRIPTTRLVPTRKSQSTSPTLGNSPISDAQASGHSRSSLRN